MSAVKECESSEVRSDSSSKLSDEEGIKLLPPHKRRERKRRAPDVIGTRLPSDHEYRKVYGSRREVWSGIAYQTKGKLKRDNLVFRAPDKFISRRMQAKGFEFAKKYCKTSSSKTGKEEASGETESSYEESQEIQELDDSDIIAEIESPKSLVRDDGLSRKRRKTNSDVAVEKATPTRPKRSYRKKGSH